MSDIAGIPPERTFATRADLERDAERAQDIMESGEAVLVEGRPARITRVEIQTRFGERARTIVRLQPLDEPV